MKYNNLNKKLKFQKNKMRHNNLNKKMKLKKNKIKHLEKLI